jgi:hypothetical protein
MRRRRIIRTARAATFGWIWIVVAIVIVLFFVVRCMR